MSDSMSRWDEAFTRLIQGLNASRAPYMMVGSFSSNLHGVPRATEDADVVVQGDEKDLRPIAVALAAHFTPERQLGFETVLGTTKHKFHLGGTAFKVEVFELSGDPHDQAHFARRRTAEWLGLPVQVPSAEDVIIQKLRWARPKDLEDIRGVLAVQAGRLDMAYLTQWCERHGTLEKLQKGIASLPAGLWTA